MPKFFVHCETDASGTDMYELIEAKDIEEAEVEAQVMSAENFQSYEHLFEDEMNDDNFEFIEGEHHGATVEEYNPEKHNSYLFATESLYEEEEPSSKVKNTSEVNK